MDRETIRKLHELERMRDKYRNLVNAIRQYKNICVEDFSRTPSCFVCNIVSGNENEQDDDFIVSVLGLAIKKLNYFEHEIDKL